MTTITKAHISDLLTVMTGVMLSTNGFDKVHELIEFICSSPVFTHQIPGVLKQIQPGLEEQFPQFKNILITTLKPEKVDEWINNQIEIHGEWFEVKPIKVQMREPIMELMDLIQ